MGKGLKTRKRYRLVFVNDNTLNTVWTVRMTRVRVWALGALCVAAIAALAVCVVVWSPASYLLPGYMRPEQRRTTVDNTLRVDSLLAAGRTRQLYIDNIISLLSDNVAITDTVATSGSIPAENSDTLMTATTAEREFVENWLRRERDNLSVLTPIVAEGMMFRSPASGATVANDDSGGVIASAHAPVVAVQDGVVADVRVDAATARVAIVVQHANDFISVYSGLEHPTVAAGQRVVSGSALGRVGADGRLQLNVWHRGRRVALSQLLPRDGAERNSKAGQ